MAAIQLLGGGMFHSTNARKLFIALMISSVILSACNLPILVNSQKQKNSNGEAAAVPGLLRQAGDTRAKPVPVGEMVSIPGWDVKVEEFLRGADALKVLNNADWQVDDPPEGYEYAIAKIFVRCTSFDENPHSLGISELFMTGSDGIGYGDQMDSWPQPEFLFEDMYTAETTEGWVDALIPVSLTDVEMVLNVDSGEGRNLRFLALEKGASIAAAPNVKENDLGKNSSAPALLGEKVITPDWTITLTEIKSGSEVESLLQTNNDSYAPPTEGTERVMLHFLIENHAKLEQPASLSYDNFYSTDDNGLTIQNEWLMLPDLPDMKWINAVVLPGAALDGWVVVTVPIESVNRQVLLDPYRYDYEQQADNLRYFAIE
jgi:hypothetical protein